MTQSTLEDPTLIVGEKETTVKTANPEDIRMYSVTTLLNALSKDALVYWSAEETAKAAVKAANSLPMRIEEDGEAETIKWLSGARFRRPKGQRSAAELGTAVHDALETLALTGSWPAVDSEVQPFIDQADKWMQKFQPTYEASEITVFSEQYRYAGTLDAIMVIDGVRFLVDYKSSKRSFNNQGKPTAPYPEQVALQLAGYRYSDFAATWRPRRYEHLKRRYYLVGASEKAASVPVPEVDACLVIHLTPEHCHGFPIKADEEVFEYFLYTIECYRWLNDVSKTVMGAPLAA